MRILSQKSALEQGARAAASLKRWKIAVPLLHFAAEFSDPL